VKGQVKELKRRLKKLQTEGPDVRAVAEEALRLLDNRLAAASLALKQGRGKALRQHPKGKAKVKAKEFEVGELRDGRGKLLATLSKGEYESVASWAFSPDGRFLAVGIHYDSYQHGSMKDGTIRGWLRLYDAATGELLGFAGGNFGPVKRLAFSADGKILLYQTGKYQEIGGG
jgi:hypothetical protein